MNPSDVVVVGVDGTEASRHAAAWAARYAVARRHPVRLVHALRLPVVSHHNLLTTYDTACAELRGIARQQLARALRAAREAAPDVVVRTVLREGEPVPVLLEHTARASLLVLGAAESGSGRLAVTVGAHGATPVVVVPLRDPPADGPVVVGVDGSPASEAAVEFAFTEAAVRGGDLVAVHTWSDRLPDGGVAALLGADWTDVEVAEQELLAQRLAGWREHYPEVRVRRVVTRDRPVRSLVDVAASARLLVVGSRGRGGFQGMLLGSTSQALLHQPPCPVAVVRPTR